MAMPEHYRATGKTNGFAITSLVTAIIGCTAWLGLIFGIIALVQIKNRGDRGSGLAIGGIVIACLWIIGALVGYLVVPGLAKSAAAGIRTSTPSPTKTTPEYKGFDDIKVGQCYNDDTNGNGIGGLTVVACTAPHDGQALAKFTFERSPWPGEKAVDKAAERQCTKRAEHKIDRDPAHARLVLSWYAPVADSWGVTGGGDRGVLCTVTPEKKGTKLTRPLKSGKAKTHH